MPLPTAGTLQAGVTAPPLPAVTVVLPVRGCRSHSVANWEAILNLDYGERVGRLSELASQVASALKASQVGRQRPSRHDKHPHRWANSRFFPQCNMLQAAHWTLCLSCRTRTIPRTQSSAS